jgi:DNA repair photolyase
MFESSPIPISIHGRGAAANPTNRFEKMDVTLDAEAIDPDGPAPTTVFLKDSTRNILATNNSPDVGFDVSLNPYRGCEHGCIYCYARPTHEYLGFSAGLDFESKIMVKADAPELLRKELSNPKWEAKTIAMSGVTDCYQPIERKMQITRRCLAVMSEFGNPVTIITKSHLVTRDIDILGEMADRNLAAVCVTMTTLDVGITRLMEPRASSPARRLDVLRQLSRRKIPVGVMVSPVVPGLTDHEMPKILEAAAEAGATFAGFTPVRLPFAVKDLFEDWLGHHFPDRKDKVLNRIRSLRGGKLNNSDFGTRMRGEGVWSDQFRDMFHLAKRKAGLTQPFPGLSTEHFKPPAQPQMTLW